MDRSAVPVMFGFDFQTNAAIVLMVENMRELSSIRLEGKEDIDIELNDGTYILAQAKSVVDSSTDLRNVRIKAKEALVSLSDQARKVKVRELVYITNSPDPFKDDASKYLFCGASHVKFRELPLSTRNLIEGYLSGISNPLDTNLLNIQVLPFEGDDERQKFKMVISSISDFLGDDLKLDRDGLRNKLHEVWNTLLYQSGTKANKGKRLIKKDIIWPIVVFITGRESFNRDAKYCTGLDDGEFEEIYRKYIDVIDYYRERYDFVAKVITDYSSSAMEGKDGIEQFVKEYSENYIDELGLNSEDKTIRYNLVKIILYTILTTRFTINQIKKAVNL